jgi:nucleotide-binding universal stress UspA family protein
MAMKFERILFCTDFSDEADNALLTALDIAEKYRARLFVLHVLHTAHQPWPNRTEESGGIEGGGLISQEILEKGTKKLKEYYEPIIGTLNNNYEFHVAAGVPFVEIVRFARAQKVNFIVLGAAGSSNIQRITFGSTAENVARRAHCTVLITRIPEKDF